MSRRDARAGVAGGAMAVHDAALAAAVFYAPIFWGGFNTGGQALTSGLVGLAAVAALVGWWAQGRAPARIPNAIHLPAVGFLLVSGVSMFFSVNWHASALEVSRLAVGVLLFWLVANRALLPPAKASVVAAALACSVVLVVFVSVPGEAGLALRLFCVIGLAITCAAIVSEKERADPVGWLRVALVLSAGLVVALYGVREKVEAWRLLDNPTWQIFSTFFNPNPLAGFLAMVFPLAVSGAMAGRALWRRLLWGFCALMVAVAVLPTYSKGGWLAFAAGVGCYVVLLARGGRRGRRALALAAGVTALVVIAFGGALAFSGPVRARAAAAVNAQSASNTFRILTWRGTVDLAADYLWLGSGPGTFKYAYPKYATAGYVEAAHQNYLQVFAEQGALGGAVFLWLVGAVLFTGRRALAGAKEFRGRVLAIGEICAIVALLVHSLLDYDWYIGAIGFSFWLVAGLLAHNAHGRPVEAPTTLVAEDQSQGARRRRRRAERRSPASQQERNAGTVPAEESGARSLAWPKGQAARGLAIAAAAACMGLWVWALSMVALSQRDVAEGDLLVMQRNVETGFWRYRSATRYDPWSAEAWERYGVMELMRGATEEDQEEGAEAIKRAIALEPTFFRRPAALASVYREKGRLAEAARYYEEALEKFPKHTKTLRQLAEVYQLLGDEESAIRVYREMLEIEDSAFNRYRALDVDVDVEYAYAHYELGRFAVREHEAEKAADGLQVGLGEFSEALRVIKDYYVRAEETDDMFRAFGRPREHRGDAMRLLEAKVRWRRADLYERLGRSERAKEERERVKAPWQKIAEEVAAEDGGGGR